MSSSEFSATGASLKPTVQVGDPFAERKLMLATEALIKSKKVIGLQDMGAAGLTSSSVEMAGRSGCGVALWLNKVPQRAANMQAFEILLSESQERMLCAVTPENLPEVLQILAPWDVEVAVVGSVNNTGLFVCVFDDTICTAIPVDALIEDIPQYQWPLQDSHDYLKEHSTVQVEFAAEKNIASNTLGLQLPRQSAGQSLAQSAAQPPAQSAGQLAAPTAGQAGISADLLHQVRTQSIGSLIETNHSALAEVFGHALFHVLYTLRNLPRCKVTRWQAQGRCKTAAPQWCACQVGHKKAKLLGSAQP